MCTVTVIPVCDEGSDSEIREADVGRYIRREVARLCAPMADRITLLEGDLVLLRTRVSDRVGRDSQAASVLAAGLARLSEILKEVPHSAEQNPS